VFPTLSEAKNNDKTVTYGLATATYTVPTLILSTCKTVMLCLIHIRHRKLYGMPKNKVWSEDVCVGLYRLWYVLMMMCYWPK